MRSSRRYPLPKLLRKNGLSSTTYEGTKAIKDSKLQRLTTSFKEIKMEEDKSFNEFYAKLKDIINSAFNLGETIHKPKIVRKVLKSLCLRDFMLGSLPLKNQRILTLFL